MKNNAPEHIQQICFDWMVDDNSEMLKLAVGSEFDPAGVIREIERRREEIKKSLTTAERKEAYFKELNSLKRYVMNLVIQEVQHAND